MLCRVHILVFKVGLVNVLIWKKIYIFHGGSVCKRNVAPRIERQSKKTERQRLPIKCCPDSILSPFTNRASPCIFASATRAVRIVLPRVASRREGRDGCVVVWKWHSDLAAKTSTCSFQLWHSALSAVLYESRFLLFATRHSPQAFSS